MQKIPKKNALLALALIAAACKPTVEPKPEPAASAVAPEGACGETGFLRGRIYGAVSASLDWTAEDLRCEGMPRPEGRGVRLRFAGSVDGHPIAIIIAMPELTREASGGEFASNVTLIEEGNARFFNTTGLNACLTGIDAMTPLDDAGDRIAVGGSLYCLSPLAEVNGESSVSIPELEFQGLLDWDAS